jgi:hypothetical protein
MLMSTSFTGLTPLPESRGSVVMRRVSVFHILRFCRAAWDVVALHCSAITCCSRDFPCPKLLRECEGRKALPTTSRMMAFITLMMAPSLAYPPSIRGMKNTSAPGGTG